MAAINEKGLLGKFLVWRVRYIKEKQFIVMLSILVGIVTGLAGVVLKNMVHFTHMFFTERMQVDDLTELVDIPTRRVLSALTVLEIDQYVVQHAGKHYTRAVTLTE